MIIGTHDSCAYDIDFSLSRKKLSAKWSSLSAASIIPCVKTKISRATLTQPQDIYQQLLAGARVLDIRVSYFDSTYYTNHTFICGRLIGTLMQIINFCNAHQTEKINLLIKPDWENRETMRDHESGLLLLINSLFGKLKESITCYYRPLDESILISETYIKNFYDLDFEWLNTDNVADFKEKIKDMKFKENTILNFVLTMDADEFSSVLKANIRQYAAELNPEAFNVLDKNNLPGFILFDFIDKQFIDELSRSFCS